MHGSKILIVTTDLDKIKLWGMFFTSKKLNVLVATQATQAIAIAKEKKPDILLWGLDKDDPALLRRDIAVPIIYLVPDKHKKAIAFQDSISVKEKPEDIFKKISEVLLKNKASTKEIHETKTLLVVDDIEVNRHLIADILLDEPIHVIHCESGQESLNILSKKTVDLIFLDIEMPVMDGWETMKRYVGMKINVPVYALTAHAGSDIIKKAEVNRFAGVITKPINSKQLVETVRKHLSVPKNKNKVREELPIIKKSKSKKYTQNTLIDLSGLDRVAKDNVTLREDTLNRFMTIISELKKRLQSSSVDFKNEQMRRDIHTFVNLVSYFCPKKVVEKSKQFEFAVKTESKQIDQEQNLFMQLLENIEQQLLKMSV